MKAVSVLAFAVFALSIGVQWNDPDPLAWSLVYAVPAGLAVAAHRGRSRPALSGALALAHALLLLPWLPSLARLDRDAVSGIGMPSLAAEEAREAGGIALCLLWCLVVFVHDRRRRARSSEDEAKEGEAEEG